MTKQKLETDKKEKEDSPQFELVEDEKIEISKDETLLDKLGVEERYDHGVVRNHIRKLKKLKAEQQKQHDNVNFYLFLLVAVIFVAIFNYLNRQAGY